MGPPSAALVTQKHWLSPEQVSTPPPTPRLRGGRTGVDQGPAGSPDLRQSDAKGYCTRALARAGPPANEPPKSAPSPQSRGSGAQVLPGPAEAHGARSWARETTAGLKAQEAGEEEAFQTSLSPRGLPRPLPETAASPGRAVNGGWLDAA